MKKENELIEKEIFKNFYELNYITNYIFNDNILYVFELLNNNYENDKIIIDYEFINLIEIIKSLNLKYQIYKNKENNKFLLMIKNENLKNRFKFKFFYDNEKYIKYDIKI